MPDVKGDISLDKTVFFLCDMQERFRDHISHFKDILVVTQRLISASKLLSIPLVVTEQYPKGLGKTVEELDISHTNAPIEKTKFSMVLPETENVLSTHDVKYCVLFGIETHVCIQQTALDLLKKGYEVLVVADASSSRSQIDRHFALQRLLQAGVIITTSESILFQLLGDKNHPKFKEIQSLVKTLPPDTGL